MNEVIVKGAKDMDGQVFTKEIVAGGLMIAGKLTNERKEALSKLLKELV
jgi:hypothetical protein